MISKPVTKPPFPTATTVKSCFRCGAQFPTSDGERVCWACRKPKTSTRTAGRKTVSFREKQIIALVAQGKTNKEIAFQLLLQEGTIKEYLNRIFRKIAVSNRTELAIWALRHAAAVEEKHLEGPLPSKSAHWRFERGTERPQ